MQLDTMWRYVCFYAPLWLAVLYMLVVYAKVFRRLRAIEDIEEVESEEDSIARDETEAEREWITGSIAGQGKESSSESVSGRMERRRNNTLQRMRLYPLVLIACYLFATLRRFVDWATEDQTPYALAMLHTLFAAIPGFLNALVYGCTKDVRRRDLLFLTEHGCCKAGALESGGASTTTTVSSSVRTNERAEDEML